MVFFVKKVDLSSTQGALCTVSVFFYFTFYLFWGGCTHPTHPPAYGPEKPPTFTQALKRQCAAAGKPRELTTALLSDIHTPSICYYYYICCRCYIFVTGTLNARRV